MGVGFEDSDSDEEIKHFLKTELDDFSLDRNDLSRPPKGKSLLISMNFITLCYICCTLNTGYAIVAPNLYGYYHQFAQDAHQGPGPAPTGTYGLVAAMFSIGHLVGAVTFGIMTDKFSAKGLLFTGLAVQFAGCVLYAMAWDLAVLFPARLIWGFSGGIFTTCMASVARISVERGLADAVKSRAVSFVQLAAAFGFVLGPALGALTSKTNWTLGTFHSLEVRLDQYRSPAWLASLLVIVSAVLTWRFVEIPPPPRAQGKPGTPGSGPPAGLMAAAKSHFAKARFNIAMHCLCNFTNFTGGSCAEAMLTPFVQDHYGWTVTETSLMWLGMSIGSAIVITVITLGLAGRVRDNAIHVVCATACAVSWLGMVKWWDMANIQDGPPGEAGMISPPHLIIGAGAFFAFFGGSISFNVVALTKITPHPRMGAVMGLSNALGSISRGVTPPVTYLLYQHGPEHKDYNPQLTPTTPAQMSSSNSTNVITYTAAVMTVGAFIAFYIFFTDKKYLWAPPKTSRFEPPMSPRTANAKGLDPPIQVDADEDVRGATDI